MAFSTGKKQKLVQDGVFVVSHTQLCWSEFHAVLITEHKAWQFSPNSLCVIKSQVYAGESELAESERAFKIKFLMEEPNKRPHLQNSIFRKFIFVWVCYTLYQKQLQMFKIAKL